MAEQYPIAGVILAGGQNSRMGGNKKLFLQYQGESFCAHLQGALAGLPAVYLSVERPEPYRQLNIPLIVDEEPCCGPLGGITSALRQCPAEALFITACDTPLLQKSTVELLCAEYRKTGKITVAQAGGRLHPLPGVYPKSALPIAEQLLKENNYRLRELFARGDGVAVPLAEDDPSVHNVNDPAEYEKLMMEERKHE